MRGKRSQIRSPSRCGSASPRSYGEEDIPRPSRTSSYQRAFQWKINLNLFVWWMKEAFLKSRLSCRLFYSRKRLQQWDKFRSPFPPFSRSRQGRILIPGLVHTLPAGVWRRARVHSYFILAAFFLLLSKLFQSFFGQLRPRWSCSFSLH